MHHCMLLCRDWQWASCFYVWRLSQRRASSELLTSSHPKSASGNSQQALDARMS